MLPTPRSSLETQWTGAYRLHLNGLPDASGFFQVRNDRGEISLPSISAIVNRDTTDYSFNLGLNPVFYLGNNVLTFNTGVQETVRRDSRDPVDMDQNLFREFVYLSTSSFFNIVSVNGYAIRETGPFTLSNLHSRDLSTQLNFRVGRPWGKTALLTGYGVRDLQFFPAIREFFFTSSYVGGERKISDSFSFRAIAEDLRAWRVEGNNYATAQALRPTGTVEYSPTRNWRIEGSVAYSRNMGFHVYDAVQSGFAVSYAMPVTRQFDDGSDHVRLRYPVRFTLGMQQESFFNFTGGNNQQFRPYSASTFFETTQAMKICLVTTFPPSGRQLNEYAFHIARELQRNPPIDLTILSDELADYQFATDGDGKPLSWPQQELPDFRVIRCWKFNRLAHTGALAENNTKDKARRGLVQPGLFHLCHPGPSRCRICGAVGSCSHSRSGLPHSRHSSPHYRTRGFCQRRSPAGESFSASAATSLRALLKAHSVSVLLPGYQRTLMNKYSAQNVLLGTHGVFARSPLLPISRNGAIRTIAFWPSAIGEPTNVWRRLMEAFPAVLSKVPNARSSSPAPIITPRPAIGSRFGKRSREPPASNSGVTCRRTPFLSFTVDQRAGHAL